MDGRMLKMVQDLKPTYSSHRIMKHPLVQMMMRMSGLSLIHPHPPSLAAHSPMLTPKTYIVIGGS